MRKLNKEPIFYIYVYLDNTKPGKYKYEDYEFDYQPFYVGKGQDGRKTFHLMEAYNKIVNKNTNHHKCNTIRKIKKETGEDPIVIEYKSNMIEDEAFKLEESMIRTIGRADLGTGPLTNMTTGGDGVSGYIATEEVKKNRSERQMGPKNHNYGKTFPKSHTDKIALGVSLHERTQAHCDALSDARKGCVSNRKGVILSDEIKQNMIDARPEMDEQYVQKIKDGFTPELRAEIGDKKSQWWKENGDRKKAEFKAERDRILESMGFKVEEDTDGRFYIKDFGTSQVIFSKKGYKEAIAAFKIAKKFHKMGKLS